MKFRTAGMLETKKVTLTSDGKITGDVTGTWSHTSGTYYCQMVIGGTTYKGVFFKQKDETTGHNERMTFTLIGSNNETIWGSKTTVDIAGVEGTFYIKNVNSLLCLDVVNGSNENNANIQQWTYNGADAQKFKIVSDGDGYYHILTGASGYTKCLDVAGKSADNNANIIQYTYNGAVNQKFKIERLADGTYALLTGASNYNSGLDVFEWSTQPGGNIEQWEYAGRDCQKWILEPAG